jgi:hypothetical protein
MNAALPYLAAGAVWLAVSVGLGVLVGKAMGLYNGDEEERNG